MAEKAFITPSVLKWARETARFSIEDAAKKLKKIEPELLLKWEEGNAVPSIRDAEKLAKIYRRSFALFFLPGPPKDFQPLQDFRQPGSKALSTASAFIIREISENQAWMRELAEDSGEKKLDFIGRFSDKDDPKMVAEDILNTLGVDPMKYEKSPTPLLQWIRRAEAVGINVSRASSIHKLKIDPEELQGFAIADSYAPFVFINSADWEKAQLFTLVHELAHLWINASGISNEIELRDKSNERLEPVERFCNKVAGNALLPLKIMEIIKQNGSFDYKKIKSISSKYGVSSFALLVRAKEMGIISWNEYKNLKENAENEYKDFIRRKAKDKKKQKEKEGGPDYYLLQLNKNGRLFTQHVLDAYYGGAIMATEASGLLNIKINKIANIRAAL